LVVARMNAERSHGRVRRGTTDQVPQTADAAVDRARRISVVARMNAERSHGRVRRGTTDQVPQTADAAVDRARRFSV